MHLFLGIFGLKQRESAFCLSVAEAVRRKAPEVLAVFLSCDSAEGERETNRIYRREQSGQQKGSELIRVPGSSVS